MMIRTIAALLLEIALASILDETDTKLTSQQADISDFYLKNLSVSVEMMLPVSQN